MILDRSVHDYFGAFVDYISVAWDTYPLIHTTIGAIRYFEVNRGAIRDYRGTIPHRTIVSAPNLGGKDNILPLSNIQSLLDSGQMTHVLWVLSSDASGGTWSDIVSHIEAPGNDTFKACPTQFTAL